MARLLILIALIATSCKATTPAKSNSDMYKMDYQK